MNITPLCFIFTAVMASAGLQAWAAEPWAVSPSWNGSSDSDGLVIHKWFATAMPSYNSSQSWQGFEWQQQNYAQNGTHLYAQGVNLAGQDIEASSGMGYSYKLGVNQGPDQSLIVADVSWNKAITTQLQGGVFANRDWVESMQALQNNVHYDLMGGNLDYQIHPRLTVVGSLTHTQFSDTQQRQQERARIIWDAWPDQGVTLQMAQKHQIGEKNSSTSSLYFNPERLDEVMGLIGWRRKYQGWQWYARVGWGQQQASQLGTTPTRLSELQLSSPVHNHSYFKLRAGQSESFGDSGAGYVYRYADLQWIWQLGR